MRLYHLSWSQPSHLLCTLFENVILFKICLYTSALCLDKKQVCQGPGYVPIRGVNDFRDKFYSYLEIC